MPSTALAQIKSLQQSIANTGRAALADRSCSSQEQTAIAALLTEAKDVVQGLGPGGDLRKFLRPRNPLLIRLLLGDKINLVAVRRDHSLAMKEDYHSVGVAPVPASGSRLSQRRCRACPSVGVAPVPASGSRLSQRRGRACPSVGVAPVPASGSRLSQRRGRACPSVGVAPVPASGSRLSQRRGRACPSVGVAPVPASGSRLSQRRGRACPSVGVAPVPASGSRLSQRRGRACPSVGVAPVPASGSRLSQRRGRACPSVGVAPVPASGSRLSQRRCRACPSVGVAPVPASVSRLSQRRCRACPSVGVAPVPASVSRLSQRRCRACPSVGVAPVPASGSRLSQRRCRACPSIGVAPVPASGSRLSQRRCRACPSVGVAPVLASVSRLSQRRCRACPSVGVAPVPASVSRLSQRRGHDITQPPVEPVTLQHARQRKKGRGSARGLSRPAGRSAATPACPAARVTRRGRSHACRRFRDSSAWVMLLGPLTLFLGLERADTVKAHASAGFHTPTMTPWFMTGIQVYLAWMAYFYLAMALRESILRVNGSKIRGWWVAHHYWSSGASVLLLGLPIHSPAVQGFFRHFLIWSCFQAGVMFLQNLYQRRRMYTRIALGKNTVMDVVAGESSGSIGQLLILYPLLFSLQAWQFVIGAGVAFKTYPAVLSKDGWLELEPLETDLRGMRGVCLVGIVFSYMAYRNFSTTLATMRAKSQSRSPKAQPPKALKVA
ncbi:MAG: hypothetical protein WDW36_000052 [Sanguina aurantia]